MVRFLRHAVVAVALTSLLVLAGCSSSPSDPIPVADKDAGKKTDTSSKADARKDDGEHRHQPAAHGGIVVPIGSDSYHAEAVFEKGGTLRLYTLGQNEAVVLDVDAQPLTGFATPEGGTESESFILMPNPQDGDKEGKTSLFLGHLPKEMAGKKVEVTIPSIRIGTERFRIAFGSSPSADAHDAPAGMVGEEERKLYMTPGGKYTEADIQANGGVVASEKFKGVKAEHDLKPKAGDLICPITLTKANPNFSWVVGGKTYQFCCPPCVDEFVSTAKEKPGEIKEPEAYRKQ